MASICDLRVQFHSCKAGRTNLSHLYMSSKSQCKHNSTQTAMSCKPQCKQQAGVEQVGSAGMILITYYVSIPHAHHITARLAKYAPDLEGDLLPLLRKLKGCYTPLNSAPCLWVSSNKIGVEYSVFLAYLPHFLPQGMSKARE